MTEGSSERHERQPIDGCDPPPGAEALARELIAIETAADPAADARGPGARVLRGLGENLARVLGHEGVAALEGRAVELARRRYRFLPRGSVRPWDDARAILADRAGAEAAEALEHICAHLVGLLFTFLGEPLTTHLIRVAWPDLGGDDDGERET